MGTFRQKEARKKTPGQRILGPQIGLQKLEKEGDVVAPPVWPPNFLAATSKMREFLVSEIADGEEDIFTKD